MLAWYIAKRMALGCVVLFAILVLLILSIHLVPGDPVRYLAQSKGENPSPEYVAQVRDELKLDAPVTTQLTDFIGGLFHGDLGRDFATREPITGLILGVLPDTVILAGVSLLLAILLGIPLGVISARHADGMADRALGAFSVLLISGLPYVIGLLFLLVFAVHYNWLPAHGSGDLSDPVDYGRHLVLPALALALPSIGYIARFVRANVLETMSSQYIRAHRAFGFKESRILYRYALKNALVPTIALFGLFLGGALAGTVYVENVFNRPGLGSLSLQALNERNWPIIRATVLLFAVVYIVANLLADILYRVLDPRIRIEDSERQRT